MGLVHHIWHTMSCFAYSEKCLMAESGNMTGIISLSHFATEFSKCHKMSQNFGQATFVTECHHVTRHPFSAPYCLGAASVALALNMGDQVNNQTRYLRILVVY